MCVHSERGEQCLQVLRSGERGEGAISGRRQNVFEKRPIGSGTVGGRRRRRSARCGAVNERRVQSVLCREARETQAVVQFWSVSESGDSCLLLNHVPAGLQLGRHAGVGVGWCGSALFGVVDEVAARAVGAEADGVEGAAWLRLVLGVARQTAQLVVAVRKLALLAVLTGAVFLEGSAEFSLVAGRVDLRAGFLLQRLQLLTALARLTVSALTELVLLVHDGGAARALFHVAVACGSVLVAVVCVARGVAPEKSLRVRAAVSES